MNKTVKTAYICFIATVVILLLLLKYAGLQCMITGFTNENLKIVFYVLSGLTALIVLFGKNLAARIINRPGIKKQIMSENDITEAEYPELSVNISYLVCGAMYEAVAIFGFIYGILGGTGIKVYAFFAASLLLLSAGTALLPATPGHTGR